MRQCSTARAARARARPLRHRPRRRRRNRPPRPAAGRSPPAVAAAAAGASAAPHLVRGPARRTRARLGRRRGRRARGRLLPRHGGQPRLDRRDDPRPARLRRLDGAPRRRSLPARAAGPDAGGARRGRDRDRRALRHARRPRPSSTTWSIRCSRSSSPGSSARSRPRSRSAGSEPVVAGIGIVGALLAPVLVDAGTDSASLAFMAIALVSAVGVLLWRRWSWLGVAAFVVSAPQLARLARTTSTTSGWGSPSPCWPPSGCSTSSPRSATSSASRRRSCASSRRACCSRTPRCWPVRAGRCWTTRATAARPPPG